MITIRYIEEKDRNFWYTLDKHLPEAEFGKKVRDKEGYIISEKDIPVGLLRYNLFWDNTPFCTLLFIGPQYRKLGYGRLITERWESDMRRAGYKAVMTSTRADESAQGFYRKLGYRDCGCMLADISGNEQYMEIFMTKTL